MSKIKHSIFCESKSKKENFGLGAILVILDDNTPIWICVKGKIYKNGVFRYWYNGKEGKEKPYRWQNFTGFTDKQISESISKLNLELLTTRNPRNPMADYQHEFVNLIRPRTRFVFADLPDIAGEEVATI
jgi:hypothetical protein